MSGYHEAVRESTRTIETISGMEYTPDELQAMATLFVSARDVLREGVLSLCTAAGLTVLRSFMEADVAALVGPRGKHAPGDRTAYRHGTEKTSVMMGGQKVPIRRPRARTLDGNELPIPTLEAIEDVDLLTEVALARMLRGVSARNYTAVSDPLGTHCKTQSASKSSVSRHFIAASVAEMKRLLNRPLHDTDVVVLMVDGIEFAGAHVLAAMGIDMGGRKHILGLRLGASENSTVCKALLADLGERGLSFDQGLLVVLDGSKALRKAVKACFGKSALVQRCRVHKLRNVLEHLPKTQQPWVKRKIQKAWASEGPKEGASTLKGLAEKLEESHPHAAASLREGLEETFTVQRLNISGLLRQSLATTNAIESAFSITRTRTKNVKNWQNGTMVLRWASAGLLEAEGRFRRIRGYKGLPVLRSEIRRLTGDHRAEDTDQAANGRETA